MSNDKVQGEGDYDAARRFEKDESEFVKQHSKDGKPIRGDADKATDEPTQAEREGLSHAKGVDQDVKDAERMSNINKKKD